MIKNKKGFSLLEVLVGVAVFLIFAVGVYSGIQFIVKIVYQSRVRILETAILSEELETVRNLPFESVGILNGIPVGVLPREKQIVRNGIVYDAVTTIRNIDDPYDGLAGGDPEDTAPADYKLVEMSIICRSCLQNTPVVLSTVVSPKSLEGASQNGSLFIHVFDANGQSVSGANVRITNNFLNPALVIEDTTNNFGMLKVYDAPTGTMAYNISVSKLGYSSDYTVVPDEVNTNPTKLPSNVVSQRVTEISFSIDRTGSINVKSLNSNCSGLANVPFGIKGNKVIGLNPDIYKYNQNFSTNASGEKILSNMEWDKYFITISGNYDLAGSTPVLPFKLTPGLNLNLNLILRPHTANSLLVKVLDAGTQLPLSDSSVRLTASGYDQTITTGLGYSRQTDWSSGSGQITYDNESKYFSDSGTVEISSPAGDLKLKKPGSKYLENGWLESSVFDLGEGVNFSNIIWEPLNQPAQCGSEPILFQLATSNTSTPNGWSFLGPDGTESTYYDSSNRQINEIHNGNRYLKYKVFLSTENNSKTPQLSEVAFTYTNECSPPGQSFFENLKSGTYTIEVSRDGYVTNSGTVEVAGNNEVIINLSPNE